jgi:hypothetical protein
MSLTEEEARNKSYLDARVSDLYFHASKLIEELQASPVSGPTGLETVLEEFVEKLGDLGISSEFGDES